MMWQPTLFLLTSAILSPTKATLIPKGNLLASFEYFTDSVLKHNINNKDYDSSDISRFLWIRRISIDNKVSWLLEISLDQTSNDNIKNVFYVDNRRRIWIPNQASQEEQRDFVALANFVYLVESHEKVENEVVGGDVKCDVVDITSNNDMFDFSKTWIGCKWRSTSTSHLLSLHSSSNLTLSLTSSESSSWSAELREQRRISLSAKHSTNIEVMALQRLKRVQGNVENDEENPERFETLENAEAVLDNTNSFSIVNIADLMWKDYTVNHDKKERHDPKANKKPKALLSVLKKDLRPNKLATLEGVRAFVKMADAFSQAGKHDIEDVLKDNRNKDLLPQLSDALGSVVGEGQVLESAMDALQGLRASESLERLLWAIAQQRNVDDSVTKALLRRCQKKTPSSKTQETMQLTLATLSSRVSSPSLSEELQSFFLADINSCKKLHVVCQVHKARYIRNIGVGSTREALMPLILKKLEQKDLHRAVKIALIQSITIWLKSNFMETAGLKAVLLSLLKEKEEMALNTAAAELMLVMQPDEKELLQVVEAVSEDTEMLAFIINRLVEFSQKDRHLQQVAGRLWSSGRLNWTLFAHGGLSSSFNRTLATMESGQSASFSFGFHMLGPMFRHSQFNVELNDNDNNAQNVLELSVFAGGLWSMVSDLPSPKEESESEPHGGMELRILHNSLRPFTFFQSTADLMAIYWSGQAEERNSALQGSQMLADDMLNIMLSNGQVMETRLKAAVSYDFGGQASISMWDKTAETVVETAAAFVVDLDASLASFATSSHLWTRAQLNLETEINLGGATSQLCIRMHVPGFTIFEARNDQQSQTMVSGRTLFLNDKNNELCNQMNHSKR